MAIIGGEFLLRGGWTGGQEGQGDAVELLVRPRTPGGARTELEPPQQEGASSIQATSRQRRPSAGLGGGK